MAWRLRAKLRKAPGNVDAVADELEEFEARMREATAAPRGNAMNAALTWPVHKLHFQKNRFLHDARYVHGTVSDALLKYLVKEKIADGALLAKWRKPGYDTVCSMSVLTKSNTNFGTVGICRTPLKDRSGQIMPNVQTGCVCCVSGCGGPIWWDDPVPEIVREQILEVDPGKAHLFEEDGNGAGEEDSGGDEGADGEGGARDVAGKVGVERETGEAMREGAATGAEDVGADTVAAEDEARADDRAAAVVAAEDDAADGPGEGSGRGTGGLDRRRRANEVGAGADDDAVEPATKKARADGT